MRRRRILVLGAAAAMTGCASGARTEEAADIRLWPGQPPGPGVGPGVGSGKSGLLESPGRHGVVVTDVAIPSMTVFRPSRPTGAAMLVAAGGGYRRIETGNEAIPAAKLLASRGVTAYVLRYRLPGEGWSPLAPFQDAQRAMRVIRSQPGNDPARVGVLGFSAGSNLVGIIAVQPDRRFYEPIDAIDGRSARPTLAGLLYPVISLLPPNDNTQARRQVAGQDPAREAAFSVQTHVGPATPPVFLAQSLDDPIAPVANTRLMEAACRAAGVPVETHLFQTGGHGWGMGHGETAQWPDLFLSWLHSRAFLG